MQIELQYPLLLNMTTVDLISYTSSYMSTVSDHTLLVYSLCYMLVHNLRLARRKEQQRIPRISIQNPKFLNLSLESIKAILLFFGGKVSLTNLLSYQQHIRCSLCGRYKVMIHPASPGTPHCQAHWHSVTRRMPGYNLARLWDYISPLFRVKKWSRYVYLTVISTRVHVCHLCACERAQKKHYINPEFAIKPRMKLCVM